jgi:predicted transcriptional regulator
MPALSSLDLLALSAEEQAVVRCLLQESPLSSDKIAEQLALDLAQIDQLLADMTTRQYILRQELDGHAVFSVQLRRSPQRVRNSSLLSFNDGAV